LTSDVSVITREEIDQAGESTLPQLLARQPGIQYTANGGAGTNSSIFIRGAGSNQSIVLIDGQRIGSATTGSTALSRIPLNQIERIEILRGPASSLYGADAIGGVVQIFTRRGEGPARVSASTGYGSYDTSDTSVGIAGGSDLVSYSVQAGYLATPTVSTPSTTGATRLLQPRSGWVLQQQSECQPCCSTGKGA
jgi:vitamin B12 transporter